MGKRAIFFDRDNTLIANDGYLGDPAKVVLIEGAAEAIARGQRLGFVVVTVSNQSGVARGMYDEEAVRAVNRRMDEMLREQNGEARIDQHEYCPFHPEGTVEAYRKESELRKPGAGMILKAAKELGVDLSASWLIGDAPRDIEAGKAAGCRTILFTDARLTASPATREGSDARPDYVAGSLGEAMDYIEKNSVKEGVIPSAEGKNATSPGGLDVAKLQLFTEQILHEIKRQNEQSQTEFSASRLLAGIVQVVVLAILFLAYIGRDNPLSLQNTLLVGMTFQVMVIALLVMSKQR